MKQRFWDITQIVPFVKSSVLFKLNLEFAFMGMSQTLRLLFTHLSSLKSYLRRLTTRCNLYHRIINISRHINNIRKGDPKLCRQKGD